jgi:cytochrome c biogenesis protein CcmG/thiol:disulfide interchange protein DsbE
MKTLLLLSLAFLPSLALLSLPVAAESASGPPAASATAPVTAPATAPGFTLPAREGTVSLDSLRGHVVLVDFWASWCDPCKQSFPWLASMHQRYAGKGLAIVAVNLDKKRGKADEFLRDHPAPFTVAYDPEGKTAEAFKVRGMPSSYLVGPGGEILYSHVGFDPGKTGEIEALIEKACAP